jgi:hypothetical protein
MSEIVERFRAAEHIRVPDLWPDIEDRAAIGDPGSTAPIVMRKRGRRPWLLAATIFVALAVLVGALWEIDGLGERESTIEPGDHPTGAPVALRSIQRVRLPGIPQGLEVGAGAAWTMLGTSPPYVLARIDTTTGVVRRLAIPGQVTPARAVVGGRVWVGTCVGVTSHLPCPLPMLLGIDSQTLQIRIRHRLTGDPNYAAATEDALWLNVTAAKNGPEGRNRVLEIDPTTGQQRNSFPVSGGMLAVDGSSVWVTDLDARAVRHYDAVSGEHLGDVRAPLGDPCWLAAGEGTAWLSSCQLGENSLIRIDPETGGVIARLSFRGNATLRVAGGYLWMAIRTRETTSIEIRRVDLQTNQFTGPPFLVIKDPHPRQETLCLGCIGGPGSFLAVGAGAVWVTSFEQEEVIRVGP